MYWDMMAINSSGDIFGDDDAMGSFRTNAAWHRKVRVQGLKKRPTRKRDVTALLAEAGSSVLPSKRRCKEKALYIAFIVFVCIVTFVTICGMLCTAIINQCSHKRNKI